MEECEQGVGGMLESLSNNGALLEAAEAAFGSGATVQPGP